MELIMKKLILILCVIGLSGCVSTSWKEMSDTEKQAWIFGGAIVLGAVALSTQEDVIKQDNCFESVCHGPP